MAIDAGETAAEPRHSGRRIDPSKSWRSVAIGSGSS